MIDMKKKEVYCPIVKFKTTPCEIYYGKKPECWSICHNNKSGDYQ